MSSRIPDEIMEEIELQEPESLKKVVTLIQDVKHTNQFSIKIPASIIDEIDWNGGDKISIEIENNKLVLKKV